MISTTLRFISEAAERVRAQLQQHRELVRKDVAELLEDHDAIADAYTRVMRNLDSPKDETRA